MTGSMNMDLGYLADRQAIDDLLNRYARGVDRHDAEIMASVFHPDAVDNHGNFLGGPEAFVDWVNPLHAGKTVAHQHCLTTQLCELDGDRAWTETYVSFTLHMKTGQLMYGSGRYIDRLEKRDGEWRIALRQTMTDSRFEADGTAFASTAPSVRGTWDRTDPSFDLADFSEGTSR